MSHGPSPESLFAAPATAAAIARADKLALLVGGYDGSGNFGDIAQLDATMELLEPLRDELLVLPVLERSRLADHAELLSRMRHPPANPLFLGPVEEDDGLVAVPPPRQLGFAACYLYGGGYLNRFWGRRKLDMLAAAERLVAGAGTVRRVASGLQAERDWLAGLVAADRDTLVGFELLGGRDPESERALAELVSPGAAFASGDDALGVLGRIGGPPAAPAPGERLRVNLHFGEHDFVTVRPGPLLDFVAAFLACLGRKSGGPVSVRPLIAYLDRHVDERPGVERLTAACGAIGVAAEEPLVLAPASIEQAHDEIAKADLTLSCSYHVALASLMAGVPTAGIRENNYYDQKFDGLREAFGLPEEFAVDAGRDPGEQAAALAGVVLDEARRAALRDGLRNGAQELRQRRRGAEARLFGRLDPAGPSHAITDLRAAPGELAFKALIDGESHDLWIRAETTVTPPADAALAACLMPAMRSGGRLTMSDPVSPRLLRTQREYQAIQAAWSLGWDLGQEPLREIEVQAPSRAPATRDGGRVAAFFSGGVDSWAMVLANPDVTDLIFVRGLDLIPGVPQQAELEDEVEGRLRGAAAKLGLELHVVATNLREMADPLIRWEAYNPTAMIAVALFLEPLFERVMIASDTDHETQVPLGTSRLVDHLWSTERLEIVDAGGRLNREQRIELIADHPVVRETLRVCWENPGGAYNCGRCRKCMLTMIPLEALGVREEFTSFPAELDLDRLSSFAIGSPISLALWEDVLDTTRRTGRPDLEAAVEDLVERGKRGFGLPPSYRGRRAAGGQIGALREGERRAAVAEQDAEVARAQLETVLTSRSWRLTAPLRRLGAALRRG